MVDQLIIGYFKNNDINFKKLKNIVMKAYLDLPDNFQEKLEKRKYDFVSGIRFRVKYLEKELSEKDKENLERINNNYFDFHFYKIINLNYKFSDKVINMLKEIDRFVFGIYGSSMIDSKRNYKDWNFNADLDSKPMENFSDKYLQNENYRPLYYKDYYQFRLDFEEDELMVDIIMEYPKFLKNIFDAIIKDFKEDLIELYFRESDVLCNIYYCKDFEHYINGHLLFRNELDIRKQKDNQVKFVKNLKKRKEMLEDGSIYQITY